MDFDLSPDQAALRDAARELLDDRCATTRVRAVHESGTGWDADLWARMVEQADSWMKGQEVQRPDRMAAMLVPGFGRIS